jgi:hypothetical protein
VAVGWHLAPDLERRWNAWDHAVDLFWADPRIIWIPAAIASGASVVLPTIWAMLGWRSPGQALLRLDTVDGSGRRPSVIRTLAHRVLRVALNCLLAVGPLWALVDPRRRTLEDRIAGVFVIVRARPAIPAMSAPHRPSSAALVKARARHPSPRRTDSRRRR